MNKNSELLLTEEQIFENNQVKCLLMIAHPCMTPQLLSLALTFSLSLLDKNVSS